MIDLTKQTTKMERGARHERSEMDTLTEQMVAGNRVMYALSGRVNALEDVVAKLITVLLEAEAAIKVLEEKLAPPDKADQH